MPLGLLFLSLAAALHSDVPSALSLSLSSSGEYNVSIDGTVWFTSGDTSVTISETVYSARAGTLQLKSSSSSSGVDGVGSFESSTLSWKTASTAEWITEFRVYNSSPTLRFLATWPSGNGGSIVGGTASASSSFPSFVVSPNAPALGSMFNDPHSANCGWTVAGAPNVTASGALLVLTAPWDSRVNSTRASVGFAAASNIATVRQIFAPAWQGGPVALSAGPLSELSLPVGYSMSTTLVASTSRGVDSRAAASATLGFPPGGVGATLRALGDSIMSLNQKTRPTPESAGPIYTGLGYSTTAFYFYNPCDGGRFLNGTAPQGRAHGMPGLCSTYQDTIAYVRESVGNLPPIRHVLLDSFWYGEGIYEGVTLWEDAPTLMQRVQSFPAGLAAATSAWPASTVFWAHNGKFTNSSPYTTDPRFSFAAGEIPQGPALWDYLFSANSKWRMAQIKQDHVGDYLRAAGTISNASTMNLWMGDMAQSALRHAVTVQYCCSPPSVLHAGAQYAAAIGARASPDYVANANGGVRPNFQWAIGVESAFHWLGFGLLPDKDTTLTNSTSTQHGGDGVPPSEAPSFYGFFEKNALKHMLAAALSGGPTSFSDAVAAANATLLRSVTRADGTVLRTSRTHTAIEAEFNSIMHGAWRGSAAVSTSTPPPLLRSAKPDSSLPNGDFGEVSSSVTLIGLSTWHTITAAQLAAPLDLFPADIALSVADAGKYVANSWDFSTFGPGTVSPAFSPSLHITAGHAYEDTPALVVLAPRISVGSDEWAVLGEVGKAIPVSPQRITGVAAEADQLVVRFDGALGELVTLAMCRVNDVNDVPWSCDVITITCPAPGTASVPNRTCGV